MDMPASFLNKWKDLHFVYIAIRCFVPFCFSIEHVIENTETIKGDNRMVKAISSSIKQAVLSRGFALGLIGIVVVILVTSIESITAALRTKDLLSSGFHTELIFSAMKSDNMSLALPILCTLPFTASFVDDLKSGYIKEYLPRITIKRYVVSKIIGCVVSGGLVIALGILLSYVSAALIFSPAEAAQANGSGTGDFSTLLGSLLLFFFSGAFWSVLGMTFAALTGSKYMAYASPFIFFYILVVLYERYFDKLYILYPREWLYPSAGWMFGNTGVVILLTELTIISALAFASCARKRIEQL